MKHLGIITLALPDFGSFARQPRSRWARTDDRSTGACPELSLTRVALTVTPPAREARVGAVVGGARLHGKLPPRAAYVLMTSIIGLALFTSGTPSPLYQTYRALWGFSSVVLTLVYATYAFGVLAALLVAGTISDRVGRRPVLIVALTALMLTTVVFMAAQSVLWLFVARAIQGLATGIMPLPFPGSTSSPIAVGPLPVIPARGTRASGPPCVCRLGDGLPRSPAAPDHRQVPCPSA